MGVVYVYGPPGVGKLTVATELAALTGFKLFHNHLTVNLVSAVFPRESAAWVRLLRHIRRDVFAGAAREGVDLIYTGVYLGTAEQTEAIGTMPFTPHLRLDTTHVPPVEAASRVAAHFSLALAEASTPMVAFRANPSADREPRA